MITPKLSFLGICFLVLIASVWGQSQEPPTWQTIVSSNAEFSIAVPGTFLVHKEERWDGTTIVGGSGGAGFRIGFQKISDGDRTVERLLGSSDAKGNRSAFDIGTARIGVLTYEGKKIYRTSVWIGTKKTYYYLSISAPTASNEVLGSVLASIRLNGQPILKVAKVALPSEMSSISVKDLKVSDTVRAAMKRKQTDSVITENAPRDYEPGDNETVYSRPVLIVRNSHARFTDEARQSNVQGTVRLRIQLKANGNVGKILVLKGLPYGLTENAVRAASEIKFVPAEVAGKPADAEVTREYTFTTY